MEEIKYVIIATESDLVKTIEKLNRKYSRKVEPQFESEKLTRTEAQKLAGVSSPTFLKMIKAGIFPEHGFRRKKFYLKSELIEGLKNEI